MVKKEWLKALSRSDEASIRSYQEQDHDFSFEAESFENGHFSSIRLEKINFSNTEWEACILDGVEFIDCDLSGALFNATTLHGVVFEACELNDTSFDGCVMQRSQLRSIQATQGLELVNSQLKECRFEALSFDESVLKSITFTNGCICEVSGEAEISGVVLRSVELRDFDTSKMQVSRSTASGMKIVPAGFVACEGKRQRV